MKINESAWDRTQLRHYLTDTLTSNIAFDEYCLEARFLVIGKKRLMINGRILKQSPGRSVLILQELNFNLKKSHQDKVG